MAEGSKPDLRLVPARPEPEDDQSSYLPRIPWKWIALGAVSLATVIGGYWLKEHRRATDLRAQILRVHETELSTATERYGAMMDRLDNWILAAAAEEPDSWADERLNISGLRSGKGLYLRLMLKDTKNRESIATGARAMQWDAITKCLGLLPASARGLYEKGAFLLPEWIEETKTETSVMKLRVTDEMLSNAIKKNLPGVMSQLQSDWFLLVLQHGPSREKDPVDVFLWDLRRDQQLLRGRIQSRGVLMPTRIAIKGAPNSPTLSPEMLAGSGSTDCSIASQIKALAGAATTDVANMPEAQAPDAGTSVIDDAAKAADTQQPAKAAPAVEPTAAPTPTPTPAELDETPTVE